MISVVLADGGQDCIVQSRMPLPKSTFWQRQLALGVPFDRFGHPRAPACASMFLIQVCCRLWSAHCAIEIMRSLMTHPTGWQVAEGDLSH
jgi:hypothetical protein